MSRLKELEEKAIMRLKLFEPKEPVDPYYLAYSGGKDSDTILILAELAGVRFEAVHNLTTADAPETVYYVRSKPNVRIDKPEISMWELIPQKLMPPTRLIRYCCSELKERGGQGRVVVTGVRKAESKAREERTGSVQIIGKPQTTKKLAEEIGAEYRQSKQGGIILNNDNTEDRELVEHCYMQSKVMVNPIYDWEDADVWEFLKYYGCKSNPLYECGFKRVGCIGCPMTNVKERWREFANYPKFKGNYIRAFDRMIQKRNERGLSTDWQNGKDVFRFWMEEDYKQITFDDLAAGTEYEKF